MRAELKKTAVVTGAATGIGQATAEALVSDGWHVVGWDLVEGTHPEIEWNTVDVGDLRSAEAAAGRLGAVGLLVNCAGIADRAPAAEMTAEQWERVVRVDLTGTFYCARALHANLAHDGGVVVNIGSIAGHGARAGRANYCAAKAGVRMLTEVLALEWAPDGIRVVAVSPGFVMTSLMRGSIEGGHLDVDTLVARTPQKRFASVEELAASIVALSGDAFSFMTGSTVLIDGGWNANGGL